MTKTIIICLRYEFFKALLNILSNRSNKLPKTELWKIKKVWQNFNETEYMNR